MSIEISQLYTYPIKGCQAVSHGSIGVTETGLAHDRQWMIVEKQTLKPVTQRERPDIAVIEPILDEDKLTVNIPFFGHSTLDTSRPRGRVSREITLLNKTGSAVEENEHANELLSGYLGMSVLLMRMTSPRPIKPECIMNGMGNTTGFADGFPVSLVSESSLTELNNSLTKSVDIDRFRPNIVVRSDEMDPYAEDYWHDIRIGQIAARVVRATARCAVPDVDQTAGIKDRGNPVTRALAATRCGIDPITRSKKLFFGQYLVHQLGVDQKITVGDTIEVLDQAESRNFEETAVNA
jgi:uncharacterized protein